MAMLVKERLKAIQRSLGIDDDGILGPATLTALERVVAGRDSKHAHPRFSIIASSPGLDQLVRFEISSARYYNRQLKNPTWPRGDSGITMGIGYDLGYNTPAEVERDWTGRIPDRDVQRLVRVVGLKGADAKRVLWRVRDVSVPLEAARKVFYQSVLSRYAELTRRAYPGIERLPADAQAMLLSLVFNRGARMSGTRRREMKAIKELIGRQDLDGIASQVRLMKRLWERSELPGLHTRRDTEADLISRAKRTYEWSELIYL